MPRLSDSMEEGVILDWLAADGSTVQAGDEIVEIETDKTNIAFEAEETGVLRHRVAPGATVPVGSPIGYVEPADAPAPPATVREPEQETVGAAAPAPTSGSTGGGETAGVASSASRPTASPTAARLAQRLEVALDSVTGSGPRGRVLRNDVISAFESVAPEKVVAPSSGPEVSVTPVADVVDDAVTGAPSTKPGAQLTRVQRLIAGRMTEAKQQIPEFWVSSVVDVSALMAARANLRSSGARRVPSVNDFVVAAAARALRDRPGLNARLEDGHVVQQPEVNICVAVASDGVLHAPVIKGADGLSLDEIARESRRVTELARTGRLALDDLRGGTFTISNLGMLGVREFNAIIHDHQAAILAVGEAYETVIVEDGAMRTGWQMHLTLTSDHRFVYGADAALFLQELRGHLQAPERLIGS